MTRRRACALGLACVSLVFPAARLAAADTRPVVRWVVPGGNPSGAYVEVSNLPAPPAADAKLSEVLVVYAQAPGAPTTGEPLPMLGSYRVESGKIRFTPQFPLTFEVVYRAVYRAGAEPVATDFALRRRQSSSTIVSAIYPSAKLLPENLLKFYLHFSAPMSRGRVYEHIHLRDSDGRDVELPFLELDEELWDPAMTRFTLLLDPGRIKRGVKPLVEVGAALHEGRRYTLVIDREWKDAAGQPLRNAAEKSFQVGPADRTPVDPAKWQLRPPAAGARNTLEVEFGEPLDRALALRLMHVVAADGAVVAGDESLGEAETIWRFVPDSAWRKGDYRLVIATTIEDLAGNNIGKPFDVDVFEKVDRSLKNETVSLPFTVK